MATNQIQRLLDYFDGVPGKQRYLALVEKAQRMILQCRWYTVDGSRDGQFAKEMVDQVVASVLSDPKEDHHRSIPDNVDVEAALVMNVRSLVSHAADSLENKKRAEAPDPDLHGNTVFDTSEGAWGASADDLTAEDLDIMRERNDSFLEFAKKDKVVYPMLLLIRDKGIDRPVELIAKELKVSVVEICNARKRLATLIRNFTEKHPRK
jgi:hypothetical protein